MVLVDSDKDQRFDKMPLKNSVVSPGLNKSYSVKAAHSGGDCNFLVRKQGLEKGSSVNTDIETVDLDTDCDLPVCERGSKMAPVENISTRVVDLDEDKVCTEIEISGDERIKTVVMDVEENETRDGLPMRNREMEMCCTEKPSTEVADVDEEELHGNLTTRNLVGEVSLSRDVNRGLSKQVDGLKSNKNDENYEFSEKRVEEIGKLNIGETSKMCSDLHKGINSPKGNDILQRDTFKLPSSLQGNIYRERDKRRIF